MSAAAFAKGLLDLEGQLTPILVQPCPPSFFVCLLTWISCGWDYLFLKVSLVSKDSSMLDGLDNASIEMEEAKVSCSLFSLLELSSFFGKQEILWPKKENITMRLNTAQVGTQEKLNQGHADLTLKK